MPFTGEEDHSIDIEDAVKLTENYREVAGTPPQLANYFSGSAISSVLAQTGCVGIRIYYAIKENGEKTLVIVGVKADGEDLDDGVILEYALPCPPDCPTASKLNGTA